MSPTVFREGPFRFFFFSREETRLHIHVQSPEGEAKYWIEPKIEIARNYGLSAQDLGRVEQLIEEHEEEIRNAWSDHFGS
jgi:Domain of unknown function (DUF4160)